MDEVLKNDSLTLTIISESLSTDEGAPDDGYIIGMAGMLIIGGYI